MSTFTEISEAMQKGRAKLIKTLVPQALEEGIPAQDILQDGLLAGMDVVGRRFKANEIFVPEVLVAARAMNVGAELLKPGGLMTICIYPGHPEGARERDALLGWARELNPREYDVLLKAYLNQPNQPPMMLAVRRRI